MLRILIAAFTSLCIFAFRIMRAFIPPLKWWVFPPANDKQISAMKDYLDVLNERSLIEHDLNTTNRLIIDKDEK